MRDDGRIYDGGEVGGQRLVLRAVVKAPLVLNTDVTRLVSDHNGSVIDRSIDGCMTHFRCPDGDQQFYLCSTKLFCAQFVFW